MSAATGAPLPGAIFTTVEDGRVVNENTHYKKKEDVYLDGGPGPNAPSKAAGLPEGDYFFQVTDPSGKDLLSTDHISCRKIHVNEHGVIDFVYPGTNYEWQNGPDAGWAAVPCRHAQGVDADHFELDAITVQLYPFDDTPNKGGVYKAWVTRVSDYAGDPNYVPSARKDDVNGEDYGPGYYHGFVPRFCKTDNFKVKEKGKPSEPPPTLSVKKFHDKDVDGYKDMDEEWVTGWQITITDPLTVANIYYTPVAIAATLAGTYQVLEETPFGTLQTVATLDGLTQSIYPLANPLVAVSMGEAGSPGREVVFGDVGLGSVRAKKIYDLNANGVADPGEPGVAGWLMLLQGTDVTGSAVTVTKTTDANGDAHFDGLLPGVYSVTEVMPSGDWYATGPTSSGTLTIESSLSGATIAGTALSHVFTNICVGEADFDTKGYWHNKNGLQEITAADVAYINGLSPYDSPSSYFDDGDEPFDGHYSDGTTPVSASLGDGIFQGVEVAPEGSTNAEISLFLIDSNAGGDPREQLAQQLLAFILNVRHRLDGPAAAIMIGGSWVVAGDLITDAIAVWESGTYTERVEMASLLDFLNNSDALPFVHGTACPVVYPD
jgi:hypothetical protein